MPSPTPGTSRPGGPAITPMAMANATRGTPTHGAPTHATVSAHPLPLGIKDGYFKQDLIEGEEEHASHDLIKCAATLEFRGWHQPVHARYNGYFQTFVDTALRDLRRDEAWAAMSARVSEVMEEWLPIAQRALKVHESLQEEGDDGAVAATRPAPPQAGRGGRFNTAQIALQAAEQAATLAKAKEEKEKRRAAAAAKGLPLEDDEDGPNVSEFMQLGNSRLDIDRGLMVKVWQNPKGARNFITGWERVWRAIFEYRIHGIRCPFSAMFCIQGTYVSVTAVPPMLLMNQPVIHLPGLNCANEGLISYAAAQLNRALCLPPDDVPLPLINAIDGRHYMVSLEAVLVKQHELPGMLGNYFRTELLDAYYAADVAAIRQLPIAQFMKDDRIPRLVDYLATDVIPQRSAEQRKPSNMIADHVLRKAFHRFGVNMSLLFYVMRAVQVRSVNRPASHDAYNVLNATIMAEMVGRVLKQFVRADIIIHTAVGKTREEDRVHVVNRIAQLTTAREPNFWGRHLWPALRRKFFTPRDFSVPVETISTAGALKLMTVKIGAEFSVSQNRFVRFTTVSGIWPVYLPLVPPRELLATEFGPNVTPVAAIARLAAVVDNCRPLSIARMMALTRAIVKATMLLPPEEDDDKRAGAPPRRVTSAERRAGARSPDNAAIAADPFARFAVDDAAEEVRSEDAAPEDPVRAALTDLLAQWFDIEKRLRSFSQKKRLAKATGASLGSRRPSMVSIVSTAPSSQAGGVGLVEAGTQSSSNLGEGAEDPENIEFEVSMLPRRDTVFLPNHPLPDAAPPAKRGAAAAGPAVATPTPSSVALPTPVAGGIDADLVITNDAEHFFGLPTSANSGAAPPPMLEGHGARRHSSMRHGAGAAAAAAAASGPPSASPAKPQPPSASADPLSPSTSSTATGNVFTSPLGKTASSEGAASPAAAPANAAPTPTFVLAAGSESGGGKNERAGLQRGKRPLIPLFELPRMTSLVLEIEPEATALEQHWEALLRFDKAELRRAEGVGGLAPPGGPNGRSHGIITAWMFLVANACYQLGDEHNRWRDVAHTRFLAAYESFIKGVKWGDVYFCDQSEAGLLQIESLAPALTLDQLLGFHKVIRRNYYQHIKMKRRGPHGLPYLLRALRSLIHVAPRALQMPETRELGMIATADCINELTIESHWTCRAFYYLAASAIQITNDTPRVMAMHKLLERVYASPEAVLLEVAKGAPTAALMLRIAEVLPDRGDQEAATRIWIFVRAHCQWYVTLLLAQRCGRGYIERTHLYRWLMIVYESKDALANDAKLTTQQKIWRPRLERFFFKYDKARLAEIDEMLFVNERREPALMEKLVKQYGPEPEADATLSRRLQIQGEVASGLLAANERLRIEMNAAGTRYRPPPPGTAAAAAFEALMGGGAAAAADGAADSGAPSGSVSPSSALSPKQRALLMLNGGSTVGGAGGSSVAGSPGVALRPGVSGPGAVIAARNATHVGDPTFERYRRERRMLDLTFTPGDDVDLDAVVRKIFLICDADHDGRVTADECYKMMASMQIMSAAELRRVFLERNGSRRIGLDEFREMVIFGKVPDGAAVIAGAPPSAAAGASHGGSSSRAEVKPVLRAGPQQPPVPPALAAAAAAAAAAARPVRAGASDTPYNGAGPALLRPAQGPQVRPRPTAPSVASQRK